MPITTVLYESFNRGEIGDYMDGRADLEVWNKSAQTMENWLVLPQGGAQKRRGFEFIENISQYDATLDYSQIQLFRFDFNSEQQYLLLFRDGYLDIYRDDARAINIETGIAAANIENIRVSQSGDTMVIVEPNTGVFQLFRNGSDDNWEWSELVLDEEPIFQYNQLQKLTVNPTTTGTGRTFTLSGATAYWRAADVTGSSQVWDDATGEGTITGLQNDATGGTAYSSSGTAANAFDGNVGTSTASGADGWIGYDFGTDKTIRVVGIRSNTTQTLNLSFETDDNSGFTSATEIGTVTVDVEAGTIVYIDMPVHTGEHFFRVRETGGESLTVQELYFSTGLVALGTVTTAFASGEQTVWYEQLFNEKNGYARAVTFANNRLWFGGTLKDPGLIAASKAGDFFNFDRGTGLDDEAIFIATLADQSVVIRDIKPKRNGLVVFSSDVEIEVFSNADAGLTPSDTQQRVQSNFGSENLPIIEVDGQLLFNTANGKQIRTFKYEFAADQYVAGNLTDLAHHLFVDGKTPMRMAHLRSYADTQANIIFVPRTDGTLAVLTMDSTREVVAWSRWTTEGSFGRCAVVESLDENGVRKPHLYSIVARTVNSSVMVYLEKLTEEERYLDSWLLGESDTPRSDWSGASSIADETVQCIGDGLVLDNVDVAGDGTFATSKAVSSVYIGYGYVSTLKTQPLTAFRNQIAVRGQRVIPKSASIQLYETQGLAVNGQDIDFRRFDVDNFDSGLSSFTGQKRVRVSSLNSNVRRDPTITLTASQPLPCTVITLAVDVKVATKG